jgi:ABC-2 type transport system ATP-binding protein
MHTDPFISVENLSYYKRSTEVIIQNLNLVLKPGDCLALVGPNGTGKTTTLKLFAGLLKPHEGRVQSQGTLGFLSDKLPLYPELTIQEFAKALAKLRQIPKDLQKRQIDQWLHLLHLETHQNQLIDTLSRGQKQRVGLLQALLHEPSIVLLDEPTQGLDSEQIADFLSCLTKYKTGRIIVFSTHFLQEADLLADTILRFTNHGINQHDTNNCTV